MRSLHFQVPSSSQRQKHRKWREEKPNQDPGRQGERAISNLTWPIVQAFYLRIISHSPPVAGHSAVPSAFVRPLSATRALVKSLPAAHRTLPRAKVFDIRATGLLPRGESAHYDLEIWRTGRANNELGDILCSPLGAINRGAFGHL